LSTLADLPSPEKIKKDQILQIAERAAENSLEEGHGLTGCGKTYFLEGYGLQADVNALQ
jgi:hypothetical protein